MKKMISIILLMLLVINLYSKSNNSTQILKAGHWIYDSLYRVFMETKNSAFLDNQPMSIGEIEFYFLQLDYETLSDLGKDEYKKIQNFLNKDLDFAKDEGFKLSANLILSPELYFKSNENIDWSFDYYINNYAIAAPILLGFSDFATIESEFFIGKNYTYMQEPNNFVNFPLSGGGFEFLFPKFTYGSFGQIFNNWGYNFHVAKEGLTIGNTKLGSIVYNKTFETDCYFQVNLFTNVCKYNLDIAQVDNKRFLYLHQINCRPIKNLKLGVLEGSLLNSSFELRYLNPLMIMHSFGSWYQYSHLLTENEYNYYDEGRFCAYLAFTFEYMPVSNWRIYGYYSQNEILDLGGSRSDLALSFPDSLGGQIGVEYNIPLKKGYLTTGIETIYTSPYLYVKQSPEWSLWRSREEMQNSGKVENWIGSPFGPDCFANLISLSYNSGDKWKLDFGYLFKIHGENTADFLFNPDTQKTNVSGVEGEEEFIWSFYPFVKYLLAKNEEEKIAARDLARNMWMHGTKEITNQISLKGEYKINSNFKLIGKTVYSFIFNNKNIEDNFDQGVELSLAIEYKLFN